MSKDGLRRHYDKLGPEERFRLDVLAMARGDTQESERLVRSCARRTYTMNDRAYAGRWSGATEITLRVYVPLGGQLAKLQLIDAFRELVPYAQALSSNIAFDAYLAGHESGSRHAWGQAGKAGDPPAWPSDGPNGELMEPDEDERDPAMDRELEELEATAEKYGAFLPEVLDTMERAAVGRAFSIWTGYSAFCEGSMRVPAEKVGAVVLEPIMGRIENLKARAECFGVMADPETVEEIRENLAATWRVVERRGI